MIISCPQCGTAYDVPDGASFVGRKVRCKACQSVWRVEVQAAAPSAPSPGEEWADPMAMLNEGRQDAIAPPVAIRAPLAAPQSNSDPIRPAFGQKANAPPPAAQAAAKPAPVEPKAANGADDFGWPDWPAEQESPAASLRKPLRASPAEALDAAASAPPAKPEPESAPPVDAISPSMAASLERRRAARQRTGFDDVEAAIAAVRTAPANGASAAFDERDRPYRQSPQVQSKADRDPYADAPGFGDGANDDATADYDDDALIDSARAGRAGLIVGWVALVAAIGGLAAFAYAASDVVVRGLPGAATYYAALGMPVNPRGLEFRDITYEWKLDARGKPVIGISGKVTNVSKEPRPVSSVVFAFIDQDGLELFDWATSIRAKALQPGSSLPFASVVPVPADAVRKVEVRFAKPRR